MARGHEAGRSLLSELDAWTQSARFRLVAVIGVLGWWLTGTAVLSGPLSGINEPYFGWDGAKSGVAGGLVGGLSLSAIIFASACVLPAAIACLVRFVQRYRRQPVTHFACLRGWLMGYLLVLPLAIVTAPLIAIHVAVSESMPDPADPFPAWTASTWLHVFGHPLISVGLLMLLLTLGICRAVIAGTSRGKKYRRCRACDYELAGLNMAVPCPECGMPQDDPTVERANEPFHGPPNKSHEPLMLLVCWLVLAAMALFVHFASSYWRPPFPSVLTRPSVLGTLGLACALVAANLVRVRHPSTKPFLARLCSVMLWMMIPIGLCILAEHVAYRIDRDRHPDKPAYWRLWWPIYGFIRTWMIPLVVTTTCTWWLVACGMRDERRWS